MTKKSSNKTRPRKKPQPAKDPSRPVDAKSPAEETRTSAPNKAKAADAKSAGPAASAKGNGGNGGSGSTDSDGKPTAPSLQNLAFNVRSTMKMRPRPDGGDAALVKYDPLQRYLAEISQYKLLSREEEVELGRRVQEEGDVESAYILVTSNLRLVVKIALEFQRVWMQNLLDLIQEGNIGLMQAVRKFDPYKNVKFSYYASFWIKAYILKFIMDNWRLVKIGTTQGQRKLFFKLKKEKQKLIDEGFDPKPKLLSDRLGVSEREIIDMDQRLDGWDVSLDAPLKEDSNTERIEFISTETDSAETRVANKEMEVLLHTKIEEFREQMTDRELEIFDLRIFSDTPVTLQEIGDRYGISRERVRQVEKNVIKKMREFFKNEIPDYAAYSLSDQAD